MDGASGGSDGGERVADGCGCGDGLAGEAGDWLSASLFAVAGGVPVAEGRPSDEEVEEVEVDDGERDGGFPAGSEERLGERFGVVEGFGDGQQTGSYTILCNGLLLSDTFSLLQREIFVCTLSLICHIYCSSATNIHRRERKHCKQVSPLQLLWCLAELT